MTLNVRSGGAWVDKATLRVRQSGAWVTKTSAFKRVGGAWVQFLWNISLPSSISFPIPSGLVTFRVDVTTVNWPGGGTYTYNPSGISPSLLVARLNMSGGTVPTGLSVNADYSVSSAPLDWNFNAGATFSGSLQIKDTSSNVLASCPVSIP